MSHKFAKGGIPNSMNVGDVAYEILSFHKDEERSVIGHIMAERAKEMVARLGKNEKDHILAHQNEIPVALRGKVVFVFTDDRHQDYVYYVCWRGDRWVEDWRWLGSDWGRFFRVLRRKLGK